MEWVETPWLSDALYLSWERSIQTSIFSVGNKATDTSPSSETNLKSNNNENELEVKAGSLPGMTVPAVWQLCKLIYFGLQTCIYDVVLCQGIQAASKRDTCVTKTSMAIFAGHPIWSQRSRMFYLSSRWQHLNGPNPDWLISSYNAYPPSRKAFPWKKERKQACGEKEPQNPGIIYMNHYGWLHLLEEMQCSLWLLEDLLDAVCWPQWWSQWAKLSPLK